MISTTAPATRGDASAMKRAVRPSTPADAAAITALFVQRGMHGNFDPEYLGWKYWRPRADWLGPRSFVIASGRELIAHAAIIPGTCAWGARRVTILHVIDWVAVRGSGVGIMVMKHIGQLADALLAIGGGAETQSILPYVGFRPIGAATGYARPLFPLRLLRSGATWKLLPRLARAAWRRSAPAARDADWQARRLAGDELSQITSVLPVPAHGTAVTERSVGLFRHVQSCPTVPMQLYAVERAGRVRGYFLLASVSGQARIADCWMDSDESADWRALILCAVEEAKHDPQAAEIVIWASDPLLAGALQACGFRARFQSPIQVRPADSDTMPEGTLRVQMLDNDAAFLSEGRNEYWG
jgi:hypothetical protein